MKYYNPNPDKPEPTMNEKKIHAKFFFRFSLRNLCVSASLHDFFISIVQEFHYLGTQKLIISIILLIWGMTPNLTAQMKVNLPENPSITTMAPGIRGYNQGDFNWVNWNEVDHVALKHEFAKLHPGIIRWPGGTNGNNYIWQDHLDENTRFNLIKVVEFIRDMNISLQYMVNFGNGSASDAANFIRLCKSTNSYWQNKRVSLFGSSDPVDLKMCEIGNESNYSHAWVSSWFGRASDEKIHIRNGNTVDFPAHTTDSLYFYGGDIWRGGWFVKNNFEVHHHKTDAIMGEKYLIQSDTADTYFVPVSYPKIGRDSIYVWAVDTILTENELEFMSVQEIYNLITEPRYSLNSNYFTILGDTAVKVHPPDTMKTNELIYIEYQSVGHDGAFAFRDSIKAVDATVQVGYCVWPDSLLLENNSFRNAFVQSPPDFIIRHTYPNTKDIQLLVDNGYFSEIPYLPRQIIQHYIIPGHAYMDSVVYALGLNNRLGLAITEWSYANADCPDCNMEIFDGILGAINTAMFAASYMEAAHNSSINLFALNFQILVKKFGNLSIYDIEPNSLKLIITSRAQAMRMLNNTIGTKFFSIDSSNISGNPFITILVKPDSLLETISIPAIKIWGGIDSLNGNYSLLLINQDDSLEHSITFRVPTSWSADSVFVETMTGIPDSSVYYLEDKTLPVFGDSVQIILPSFSLTALRFFATSTGVETNTPLAMIYKLNNAYPNPFNSSTCISYQLPTNTDVTLEIYNVLGRKVHTLVKKNHTAGNHSILWDGKDDSGNTVSSGIYFYELKTKNGFRRMKRLLFLK